MSITPTFTSTNNLVSIFDEKNKAPIYLSLKGDYISEQQLAVFIKNKLIETTPPHLPPHLQKSDWKVSGFFSLIKSYLLGREYRLNKAVEIILSNSATKNKIVKNFQASRPASIQAIYTRVGPQHFGNQSYGEESYRNLQDSTTDLLEPFATTPATAQIFDWDDE